MESARSLGMVALIIVVIAAGIVVCPCAAHVSDRDHGCCAEGAALRAAGPSCCGLASATLGVAASVEGGPAILLSVVVASLPARATVLDPARTVTSLLSVSPPTVLRI
jgi:hypothetical protein